MNKELIIEIVVGIVILCILILCLVILLDQLSPIKECEDKPDDWIIQIGKSQIPCGQFKHMNVT